METKQDICGAFGSFEELIYHVRQVNHGIKYGRPPLHWVFARINSELGGVTGAIRENRITPDYAKYEVFKKGPDGQLWAFERYIKNTLQDELADVAIMLCDVLSRYGFLEHLSQIREGAAFFEQEVNQPGKIPAGQGLDAAGFYSMFIGYQIGIAWGGLNSAHRQHIESGVFTVGVALAALYDFAGAWACNLDWHIKEKLIYNQTRPDAGEGKKHF